MVDVDGVFRLHRIRHGASRHTKNLVSAAWVIYTPTGQVLSSGGVCLRPSSNILLSIVS